MRQKALGIGLALILIATASLGAVAQSVDGQDGQTRTYTTEELSSKRISAKEKVRDLLSVEKQARLQQKCIAAQEKIVNVADRLATFQDNHAGVYNNWYAKVLNLLTRLESTPGVDSSQLKTDLQVLDALIIELQAEYGAYATELTTLLNIDDCTEDPQAFYDALQIARALRAVVIDGLNSVKDYIQTNIKDDLKDIKDQLVDSKNGDSSGEDEEE